jgi:hypothetical protein
MLIRTARPVLCLLLAVYATLALAPVCAQNDQAPPFDWQRLEDAHRRALVMLRDAAETDRSFTVVLAMGVMLSAGAEEGLAAPPGDFGARRAAAILNDYGFIIQATTDAEPYYRRAIALDSTRTVAHLNLADLLNDRSRDAGSVDQSVPLATEAAKEYRRYLALGGRMTPKIRAFLKDGLEAARLGTICDVTARSANDGNLKGFVSNYANGVLTKDGLENLAIETTGTAHFPMLLATMSATGMPAIGETELPAGADRLMSRGDNLGLVQYRSSTYVLYYRDPDRPISMVALTPGARPSTCSFSSHTVETVPEKANEPELCRKLLLQRNALSFIEFTTRAPITGTNGAGNAFFGSMATMDAFNDGQPINAVEVQYSSSAGAGCDTAAVSLVDAKGEKLELGPKSDLLEKLQQPVRCGGSAHFLSYENKVYVESETKDFPKLHTVNRIDGNAVVDVCHLDIQTVVSVD